MANELPVPPPPPGSVVKLLAQISKKCETLTIGLDKVSVWIDDVQQTLAEVPLASQPGGTLLPATCTPCRSKGKRPAIPQWASSAELVWDGSHAMLIVDGQNVRLTRMPGLLAEELLRGRGTDPGLAGDGWQTCKELALRLGQRAGRRMKKHALQNLISRLRETLRGRADLRGFVQHHPVLGYRFALRRYETAYTGISCANNGGSGAATDQQAMRSEVDYEI